MRRVCIIAAVAVIASLFGCVENKPQGPNSLPSVGSSIDKAHGHVDSAESANQRIKPHADKTGQELVNVVSDEHGKADKELANAKQELNQARNERDILQRAVDTWSTRAKADESTYGFIAEVWVKRFLVLVATLLAIHFIVGAAAAVLPLFFPAVAVAVPVLRTISAICNPAAWAQFVYDHIHLKQCQNSKPTITITQAA
jgi:hypothetical protein